MSSFGHIMLRFAAFCIDWGLFSSALHRFGTVWLHSAAIWSRFVAFCTKCGPSKHSKTMKPNSKPHVERRFCGNSAEKAKQYRQVGQADVSHFGPIYVRRFVKDSGTAIKTPAPTFFNFEETSGGSFSAVSWQTFANEHSFLATFKKMINNSCILLHRPLPSEIY